MVTKAQKRALLWLRNRGGSGVFDKNNVLIAQGERAPVMRASWTALVYDGCLVTDGRRASVTPFGNTINMAGLRESWPPVQEPE